MWTYSTTIERHSPLQDRSVLFAWGKYQQHRPKVEDLEVTIWHQLKTRNEGVLTPSYRVEEDIDVERSSHCLGRRRWWGRWLSVHKRWRWMCLENSTNNTEESSHPYSRNEERHSSSQSHKSRSLTSIVKIPKAIIPAGISWSPKGIRQISTLSEIWMSMPSIKESSQQTKVRPKKSIQLTKYEIITPVAT